MSQEESNTKRGRDEKANDELFLVDNDGEEEMFAVDRKNLRCTKRPKNKFGGTSATIEHVQYERGFPLAIVSPPMPMRFTIFTKADGKRDMVFEALYNGWESNPELAAVRKAAIEIDMSVIDALDAHSKDWLVGEPTRQEIIENFKGSCTSRNGFDGGMTLKYTTETGVFDKDRKLLNLEKMSDFEIYKIFPKGQLFWARHYSVLPCVYINKSYSTNWKCYDLKLCDRPECAEEPKPKKSRF